MKYHRNCKLNRAYSLLLFFIFSLLFPLQTIRANSKQSAKKISIEATNQPIDKVFSEITSQTGLKFFYNESVVGSNLTVNLNHKLR